MAEGRLPVRRACSLAGLARSAWYSESVDRLERDGEVIDALQELAEKHPRRGFWKYRDRLRLDGKPWNHKRIYRVYCELGLNHRRRTKRRIISRPPQPLEVPAQPNAVWSLDFMHDTLYVGRCFRTLIAMGVRPDGKRTILGTSVSLSEAEVHWRGFLESLQDRGMHGVELVVSDDHKGIEAALEARLTGVPWQRCQFHLQRNAAAYVARKDQRLMVVADIRAIFNAPRRAHADELLRQATTKYRKSAPKLAAWMEANVPEGLTVLDEKLDLTELARRRLRTTNGLERVNKEIKRRTSVATLFPNEESVLGW